LVVLEEDVLPLDDLGLGPLFFGKKFSKPAGRSDNNKGKEMKIVCVSDGDKLAECEMA
jgi:hypothetical protein